jgi:hypothetical protein
LNGLEQPLERKEKQTEAGGVMICVPRGRAG